MEQHKDTEAFCERLKKQLEDDTTWPAPYLFKFIVPAELDKIAEIRAIFDDLKGEINTRDSVKGNYTSVSIKVNMKSPDHIIEKYLEVSKVEGVISL